jgi:hypothetical protein
MSRLTCETANAYHHFRTALGGKTFTGQPMPMFNELPRSVQTEWKLGYRVISRWKSSGMPCGGTGQCPGF